MLIVEDSIIIKKKTYKFLMALIIILVLIVSFLLVHFIGNKKASSYTEAEHLERVTKRLKSEYIDGNKQFLYEYGTLIEKETTSNKIKATDFTIYPLYDENDRMKYVLVEFKPFGYMYIYICDEQFKEFHFRSMYLRSSDGGEKPWTPYKYIESARYDDGELISGLYEYNSKYYRREYETDSEGNDTKYTQSPFVVRAVQNEKKYLIKSQGAYIPSVIRNNKYLNLMSNEEYEMFHGESLTIQQCEHIAVYYNDSKGTYLW